MCSRGKRPETCQRRQRGAELHVCFVTFCLKMREKSIHLNVRVLICLGGNTRTLFVYQEGNCLVEDGRQNLYCKSLKLKI